MEAKEFEIEALPSEDPCDTSNLTLNGELLPFKLRTETYSDDFTTGRGNVNVQSGSSFHSVYFSWNSSCLLGGLPATDRTGSVALLLEFQVEGVDGQDLKQPVGFRLSYRHLPIPQLLRLGTLVNAPKDGTDNLEPSDDWRDPPAHLRIDVAALKDNLQVQAALSKDQEFIEHEIEELRELQSHVRELRDIIRTKEKVISTHLGKDVFTLTEYIDQCDNFGCVLKAILHKAHGAIKGMYARLRDHSHDQKQKVIMASNTQGHWNETRTAEDSPNDSNDQDSKPKLSKGLVVALGAVAAALGCSCIFIAIRCCCCSSRQKVERLADRQERRNLRSYKRAYRRRRWRDWWHKRDRRISDYEEKRSLIRDQEGLLEEAMQEEIRQLHNAHEVVSDIVRAEEGRYGQPQTEPANQHSGQYTSRRSSNASDRYSLPLSRTSSLPSYTTEPGSAGLPGYEEHDDEITTVADGFAQYAPSSSSDHHWSPESSIIEISPRQSTETMRTKYEDYENQDEHRDKPYDDEQQNQYGD
ncbi:MAG: hypothetical protein Q9157_004970 [Trypethelium eluteriae]